MPKETSLNGAVAGAIVGGAIGAITALLLAPKSGRELRSDLCAKAQSVKEHTSQLAGQLSAQAKELAGSMTGKSEEAPATACHSATDLEERSEGMNTMAPSQPDMVKLGKEMDRMPTHSELRAEGKQPDPEQ
ncbi:YtxH domain-containing protein [Paenibacillus sp. J5C_2022]|uniref:YtxH domain-containing protein n=1 Tax=Paenibacillus sp. J5C2022 TaxID=2977129 RepID=UPI0021CE2DC0|nr:YtxH domain-containing protein [Paenibacillus sp. J5C2022]MCU6710808.1 YtxH domain-containing protein [Paenibacillus sp. J5C2022]